MSSTRPLCRHCNRKPPSRPRGLCWVCFYSPGVRDLYPSTSKFCRRGVTERLGILPLPAEPTDALPGTAAKIAALTLRASRHEQLWHPEDVDGRAVRRNIAGPRRVWVA
jgi:hypothetical protein